MTVQCVNEVGSDLLPCPSPRGTPNRTERVVDVDETETSCHCCKTKSKERWIKVSIAEVPITSNITVIGIGIGNMMNHQRPGGLATDSKHKKISKSKRFSSIDWGMSFRALTSMRQLQPGKSVRFDDMDADDYDEDIPEEVAAAVSFIAFPSNTAILYWKDMGGNDDTAQQQQGREQEMLELAERIAVACGDLSTSSCLKLCSQHMCCVEEDDEYSCKSDVTKDCAGGTDLGCLYLYSLQQRAEAEEKDMNNIST
eukprot:scaffold5845_cov142-Skeletonema_marinoi.AAC.2